MKKANRRLEFVFGYGCTVQNFLRDKTPTEWGGDLQLRHAVTHALAEVERFAEAYDGEAAF